MSRSDLTDWTHSSSARLCDMADSNPATVASAALSSLTETASSDSSAWLRVAAVSDSWLAVSERFLASSTAAFRMLTSPVVRSISCRRRLHAASETATSCRTASAWEAAARWAALVRSRASRSASSSGDVMASTSCSFAADAGSCTTPASSARRNALRASCLPCARTSTPEPQQLPVTSTKEWPGC